MIGLPPCRPHHRKAVAMFIVTNPAATTPGQHILRTEPVTVVDQQWCVRRDGRLVPLDSVRPLPDALQMQDGTVESGDWRWWPDRPAFLRAVGIDPDPIQKKEYDR